MFFYALRPLTIFDKARYFLTRGGSTMISKELKTRLDTFIDAILAIIITIMVLELPAQSWEHHANITNFFLA
ncbi:TMEM175 family protein, partial [uncultured Lacticaseibacillus sp.]|uniref:TMEM175 family protein n=1 Tax=uncultured Lacticaseibacillus sp. TaxID=2775882 RepID=UPI00258F9285